MTRVRERRDSPIWDCGLTNTLVVRPGKTPRLDITAIAHQPCLATPVSPARGFLDILAERQTRGGNWYKVQWQASWVHESHLPDIEPVRRDHYLGHGTPWQVIPCSPDLHSKP